MSSGYLKRLEVITKDNKMQFEEMVNNEGENQTLGFTH